MCMVILISITPFHAYAYTKASVQKSKVENLRVSEITMTSVTIKWNAVKNVSCYQVERATKKDGKYTQVAST